jgi:hypothetical protein
LTSFAAMGPQSRFSWVIVIIHETALYSVPGCPATSLASITCGVYSPPMARMRLHRTASPKGLGNGPIRSGSGRGKPDPEFGLSGVDPWRVQLVWGTNLHSRI